jgi:hypothetical protein
MMWAEMVPPIHDSVTVLGADLLPAVPAPRVEDLWRTAASGCFRSLVGDEMPGSRGEGRIKPWTKELKGNCVLSARS